MAGKFAEGFDWIPLGLSATQTTAFLETNGWYTQTVGAGSVVGWQVNTPARFSGHALYFNGIANGGNAQHFIRPAGGHIASGYISAGVKVNDSTGFPVLVFFDAVNSTPLVRVLFGAFGVIHVYVGTTLIGSSDPGAFDFGVWFDAQCFATIDSGMGEVWVKIDTVDKLHLISENTAPTGLNYFDSVGFGYYAPGAGTYSVNCQIDDWRFNDTSGSFNNSFMGTNRVQYCPPSANGSELSFSRSNTGLANWQNWSNQAIDDSLYLYSPNTGDANTSTISPLVNAPVVYWVQVTGFYRQDDATQRFIKNRIIAAATTSDGASFPTTQSYSGDTDIWELNPHTGISFTGAEVNALEIGAVITG